MHPEQAALLAAVVADPDSDAPRLVYADWLDDHGDAARAEYIRAQCEFARLRRDDPRRARLTERMATLLSKHSEGWEGLAVAWKREFERGFVKSVWVTAGDFTRGAKELFAAHPLIDTLHVSDLVSPMRPLGQTRYAPVFASTPELARVRVLDLSGCAGEECGLSWLFQGGSLRALRELNLAGCALNSLFLERAGEPPIIDRPNRTGKGRAARQLLGLRRLSLRNCSLTADRVESLAHWSELADIETLDLSYNQAGDGGAIALAASPRLGKLRSLQLAVNGIGRRGAFALAASAALKKLDEIDLGGNEIPELALDSLLRRFGSGLAV